MGDTPIHEFVLGSLAPGQTTTRTVHTQVPALHTDQALSVAARVSGGDTFEDVRMGNNVKAVRFQPVQ